MFHAQIGDVLAARDAAVFDGNIAAHFDQRIDQARAGGVHEDVFDNDLRTGHDERCHQRETGRGGIAGDDQFLALEVWQALDADGPDAIGVRFDRDVCAEAFEHLFGVVAGHDRFDHCRSAGDDEAGQQYAGFDLGRGHGHAVIDGNRVGRAAQRDGEAVVVMLDDLDADGAQGIEHALHGAGGEGGIACKAGGEGIGAHQPHGEADAGAGIAEIEIVGGSEEAAHAQPVDLPCLAGLFDLCAQRLHGAAGGQDVVAFEEARDDGAAQRHGAEHHGPVGNRLVAGHLDGSRERTLVVAGARTWSKGMGHGRRTRNWTGGNEAGLSMIGRRCQRRSRAHAPQRAKERI